MINNIDTSINCINLSNAVIIVIGKKLYLLRFFFFKLVILTV